jgi:hypothetical protein
MRKGMVRRLATMALGCVLALGLSFGPLFAAQMVAKMTACNDTVVSISKSSCEKCGDVTPSMTKCHGDCVVPAVAVLPNDTAAFVPHDAIAIVFLDQRAGKYSVSPDPHPPKSDFLG